MDYDSKEGIEKGLGSYADFYEVMRARNGCGHKKGIGASGRLTPFTILGRYYSDQFGQCRRLERTLFTDQDRAQMPAVMTDEEFWVFFNAHVRSRIPDTFFSIHEGTRGMAPAFPLPPPHIVCLRCGGTWNIETCHDIDAEGEFEMVDLMPFVGKTLREAKQDLTQRTDTIRQFGHPLAVHNPQWADSEIDEDFGNPQQRGWRRETREDHTISWDYQINPGDSVLLFCYHFYHSACFQAVMNERMMEREAGEIRGIRVLIEEEAGFEDVRVAKTLLPAYLHEWLRTELRIQNDTEDDCAKIPYIRVETRQGNFGIVCLARPLLDLHESGVSAHDLEPEHFTVFSANSPAVVEFSGKPEQLLRLWQLMVKRSEK